MRRWLMVVTSLLPLGAFAARPLFSNGAAYLSLQYGPGLWQVDRGHLAAQVGEANANLFADEAKGSHCATLSLGYNILGHASLEAALTATGWNLATIDRGGAGFAVGLLHWHPLELVWRQKERPVPVDASAFFGLGYGIAGQERGMDGLIYEAGVTADYFLVSSIGLGLFARGVFLQFDKFYLNYDARSAAGNTLALPRGSGGAFWTFGANLSFRFET